MQRIIFCIDLHFISVLTVLFTVVTFGWFECVLCSHFKITKKSTEDVFTGFYFFASFLIILLAYFSRIFWFSVFFYYFFYGFLIRESKNVVDYNFFRNFLCFANIAANSFWFLLQNDAKSCKTMQKLLRKVRED